jgi:hypothetical protein
MNTYGSECLGPIFAGFGISWRWVASFTPRPLYSRGMIGGLVHNRAFLDDAQKRLYCSFAVLPSLPYINYESLSRLDQIERAH